MGATTSFQPYIVIRVEFPTTSIQRRSRTECAPRSRLPRVAPLHQRNRYRVPFLPTFRGEKEAIVSPLL